MTICTDTTYTPFARPDDDNWHYDTDTAYGAWSRCTYADYAVRGVFGCGWRILAHRDTWYERAGCCLHSPVWGRHRTENPSRLREYTQACVALARCNDAIDALWGLRLKEWNSWPSIDHRFDAINTHAQAAFNAARRTVQIETAYLYCYCVPDPYDTDCEVM